MARNIFDKAIEAEDIYDSGTTLSAELGDLIKGLPAESKVDISKHIINNEYDNIKLKIWLGFSIIIIGIILFFLGINDIINFEIDSGYISAKLVNVSPGAFVCLLGSFIIIFAKPKIKK